jgi:hypothetical protein
MNDGLFRSLFGDLTLKPQRFEQISSGKGQHAGLVSRAGDARPRR